MRRLAVLLIILAVSVLDARSEPGMTPRFVNYSAADGLPSNTVYAIAQDADGCLWIGTRNGLASFDGQRFSSWKEYGRVNALTVDRDNRLWVGTTDGLRVNDDRVEGNIRALLTDSDGFVWATVGDTLLLKLSYKDGIREEARCWYDKRDSEGDYPYYQIYEASDGRLWLAGRLVRNQFVEDRKKPQVTHPAWNGMFCNGSYAESSGELYVFEDHTSLLYVCRNDKPVLLGRLPIAHTRLMTDSNGRLWAAGSYGLGIVDTDRPEQTRVLRHKADDPSSLSSGELFCIFEDNQGNIWVGGDNGLSVLSSALQQVRQVSAPRYPPLWRIIAESSGSGRPKTGCQACMKTAQAPFTWASGTTPDGKYGRMGKCCTRTVSQALFPKSRQKHGTLTGPTGFRIIWKTAGAGSG